MKALLPFLLLITVNSFANTICITPNGEMRITKFSDSIWFERPLGNGESQQFSMPLIAGEADTYGNYSTKLVLTRSSVQRFVEDKLVSELPLSCDEYTLKEINGRRSQFPRKLRAYDGVMGDTCGWSTCQNLYFEVGSNFNLDYQGRDLSMRIGDMGDWYDFVPNSRQQELIQKYMAQKHQSLMAKVDHFKKSGITFEGYVFARDWYYGIGRIGLVLKKGNTVMLLPVSFDYYEFGDESLDNTY